MRARLLDLLAMVSSIDIGCLTDSRVFGQEAVAVIDALVQEGRVKRSGNTLEFVR